MLVAGGCTDIPTAPDDATNIQAAANKPDRPPGQDKPKPGDTPESEWTWLLETVDGSCNTFTVWAASEAAVWMAGGYRTLWHYDGTSWSSRSGGLPPSTANTNQVFGFSETDVFLAGQRGVERFDGSSWTTILSGMGELFGIWGESTSDLFVSGDGRFLHYDGASWTNIPTGLSTSFNVDRLASVWGSASDDVYAGGRFGRILHWDGSQLQLVMEAPGQHVHALHGSGRRNVFAVGTNGSIWHFDGKSWERMESGTSVSLNGILALGRNEAYAAGHDGVLLRYDGKRWSALESGTEQDLYGMFALGSNRIYIATVPGSVLIGTR
jgi:photosystem II stability/assembly factor-like uncharacterized protein